MTVGGRRLPRRAESEMEKEDRKGAVLRYRDCGPHLLRSESAVQVGAMLEEAFAAGYCKDR